ncbi:uncharacterized protein UDID_05057 [Ustilago sp. UG-2017a]|nr:uncharacterized protein UDID_05057 [Ustilago sp. UG-2017a]
MVASIIDASWHRMPEDQFGPGPSSSTPFDPSSSTSHHPSSPSDEEDESDWSFEDTEELITLDLGPERVARRALLGHSVGLDYEAESGSVASGSARSIRGYRGAEADKQNKRSAPSRGGATKTSSAQSRGAGPHMGAGKMLSITGLDTPTPLMKIDDTVLRGRRMDLFGTEIVLADDFDPTRPRGNQHRLRPIPPSINERRANTQSSSTRKRILFRPIYDPKQRENAEENDANLAALRALIKQNPSQINVEAPGDEDDDDDDDVPLASLCNLTATGDAPQRRVGKGKYKRKQVSEEEQIIRAAERKIRKAAKQHIKQQQEEEAAAMAQEHGQEQTHGLGSEQQGEYAQEEDEMQQIHERQPPPAFHQQ